MKRAAWALLPLAIVLLLAAQLLRTRPVADSSPLTQAGCPRCNLVLLSLDSLRADRLAAYGGKRGVTPNLDRWAKGAIVFRNYSSASTLTPISQATVHTGLFPERNGVVDYRSKISPSVPTLSELLRAEGYATAAISTSPDFDVYPGFRESFGRGLDKFELLGKFDYPFFKALDWLKAREREKRPFFLWLALSSAHWPYGTNVKNKFADPGYRGPFKDVHRFPFAPSQNLLFQLLFDGVLYPRTPSTNFWFWNFVKAKVHWPFAGQTKPLVLAPADLEQIRNLYDNNVADLDEKITILWDALAAPAFAKNTVVVLLSEHGEDLHDHGSFHHHDLWQTILSVPLLLRTPAEPTGRVVDTAASGVDVLPTLLAHLGLKPAAATDGRDLLAAGAATTHPVFSVRTPLWETVLNVKGHSEPFDRFREFNGRARFKDYAVRMENWKLIHRRSIPAVELFSLRKYVTGKAAVLSEFELYDLEKDPGETINLHASHPVPLSRLKPLLLEFERRMTAQAATDGSKGAFQEYF